MEIRIFKKKTAKGKSEMFEMASRGENWMGNSERKWSAKLNRENIFPPTESQTLTSLSVEILIALDFW